MARFFEEDGSEGTRQLISHDPLSGISCFMHFDPVTGDMTIEHEQTAAAMTMIIEENKRRQNDDDAFKRRKSEFRQIASIPNIIMIELKEKGILDDDVKFRRWLDDRDNLYMRTNTEKVSK